MYTTYSVGDLVELKCNNNKDVMNAVIVEKHAGREQVFITAFSASLFGGIRWTSLARWHNAV